MDKSKYQTLRLQAQRFVISNGQLYWKDPDGILLLCLVENETHKVMGEFHGAISGGYYSLKTVAHKTLKAIFYWPTLFGEVHSQVRACQKC